MNEKCGHLINNGFKLKQIIKKLIIKERKNPGGPLKSFSFFDTLNYFLKFETIVHLAPAFFRLITSDSLKFKPRIICLSDLMNIFGKCHCMDKYLVYFILKVLAWEIYNMKWVFAKKIIIVTKSVYTVRIFMNQTLSSS